MTRLVIRAALPRLERLLALVGVPVLVDGDARADVVGPDGPIDLTSSFPFHQLRGVLTALDLRADRLTPSTAEGRAWQGILQALEDAPCIVGHGEPDLTLPMLPTLESALDVHQALEVQLVQHRLTLMQADLPAARRTWADFSRVMQKHLVVEDTLVSSQYVAHPPEGGYPRGGAPAIFDNEHAKIRAKLGDFRAQLEALDRRDLPGPERAAACLELLDRQKIFADLLEHHDLRERAFAYPRLEAVLSAAQKAEIVEGLLAW